VFEDQGDFIHGSMPIGLEPLPSGNWLIITRDGHVVLMDKDFLNIAHDFIPTNTYWDSGLMSVVLDPDFSNNGFAYFYFTSPDSDGPCEEVFCNTLVKFRIDESSDLILKDRQELIKIPMMNRQGQHNGGGMIMGSDGLIYLGVGDGGFYDGPNAAQDENSLLGKILAIDPSGINPPIIAAMGVRNPFTMSLIPGRGLLIGDVGAETFEEINFLSFDASILNFGWPIEEGPVVDSNFSQPIFAYKHCDETPKDEDPFGHDAVVSKSLTVKFHQGVVHACDGNVLTSIGFYPETDNDPYNGQLKNTAIYSEIYYGFVRGLTINSDGSASNDRHLAHSSGITAARIGPDGYLYAVSIIGTNHVLKLIPNPEAAQ